MKQAQQTCIKQKRKQQQANTITNTETHNHQKQTHHAPKAQTFKKQKITRNATQTNRERKTN